jgi:predicted ATPase/DNA-binding SARP family transcriptional activator
VSLRFEVLGPLRVLDDGVAVDLGGPRQRRVLAVLLAAAPDGVSVDRLVEEVWADDPPATASHVVRTYVSNLRAALGDRIVSDGHRYRLDTGGDEVDASELERRLAHAGSLLEIDAATAAALLEGVAQLVRGRPFEGEADDALLVRARAEELEEVALRASELRAEAALRVGNHEEEVPRLVRLVEHHPLREGLTARLMLALYRSGRQAEALRAYRDLARRLAEELGIDPSPAVRDLEERILLQDPGLSLRPPSNAPVPASSFIGRLHELGEVVKRVQSSRLVTLMGVGGVGKTRLAAEAVSEVIDDFPDGVWWIDLAPADDPAEVTARAADVLGVAAPPGMPLEAAVARFVSGRTTLLILDNCEHLVEAAAMLAAALLAAGPGVKVLATSRRALNATGEVRYEVPSMSLPDPDGEEVLLGVSDAERLFVARASEAAPSVSPGPGDAADIARICRKVDGLPLAIEMAAARSAALSPKQIAERLAEGPGILRAPEIDRHPRQRTMEQAIGWSYDLLDPVAAAVFERISVFAGRFGLEAATAVCGFGAVAPDEVLAGLSALVDASMLTPERSAGGEVGYRLLATLREYAAVRLEASSDAGEAKSRHARYHLDLAEAAGEDRTTTRFAPWMGRLEAVRDDLAPALDWSLDSETPAATLRALPGFLEYWQRRGDPGPAYHYGVRMLEVSGDAPAELRAYTLMCASFGAALTGDFDLAARGPAEAIEVARDAPGWRPLLWAYMSRGQIATILGDLPAIAEMGREVLAVCDAHGLGPQRAYGLSLLAEADFFTDADYDAARRSADEAIAGFRRLQDLGGLKMYGLCIAAPVAALQGDLEAAGRYATEAITLPGAAWSAAAYVILGGYVLHPAGDLERAERVLATGTRLAYETSNEIWMRTGLLFLARIAADREEWERAARLFGACRPNLPAWGQQSRWWVSEPAVRRALGDDAYERIAAAGAAASPGEIVAGITRGG